MQRLFAVISLGLLSACTQKLEVVDRAKVIDTIQRAETAQAAALGRKDLDAAVAVFAKEATLYSPGMPPAHGRAAIKAVNERALEDPLLNVDIDEHSRKWWVAASGDLATTTYRYVWTHTGASGGKPVSEQIISQTTWARQSDGTWQNVSDINAIVPATGLPTG